MAEPFEYTIFGNRLELRPVGGVKPDSLYEIRIKKLESVDGKKVLKYKVYTVASEQISNFYTLGDVNYLIDVFDASDTEVLYALKEASRFAQFLLDQIPGYENRADLPYLLQQFCKLRATLSLVSKHAVTTSTSGKISGHIGNISFGSTESGGSSSSSSSGNAPSLSDLIKMIKAEMEIFEKLIVDPTYLTMGRAEPRTGKRSYTEKQKLHTYPTTLFDDLSRSLKSLRKT
jgi:hypothetical protein|nr:MAG TPA: hypothetical protein [Caudoviricetes sp.]DAR93173.1 MAG TPA: hypothetical protein [Caudoviricetes sp.]DAX67590.1 MAG TPA: hypothetical protein [Caudoviricetes sp.]